MNGKPGTEKRAAEKPFLPGIAKVYYTIPVVACIAMWLIIDSVPFDKLWGHCQEQRGIPRVFRRPPGTGRWCRLAPTSSLWSQPGSCPTGWKRPSWKSCKCLRGGSERPGGARRWSPTSSPPQSLPGSWAKLSFPIFDSSSFPDFAASIFSTGKRSFGDFRSWNKKSK